jgi:hypothetical protein
MLLYKVRVVRGQAEDVDAFLEYELLFYENPTMRDVAHEVVCMGDNRAVKIGMDIRFGRNFSVYKYECEYK